MPGFRALSPNINVNTESGQLRTELQNTFARLDGTLQLAPYRLAYQIGDVSNSGSTETDLYSYNAVVGTLAKQGSSILIFASGTTAANANNKTLKLYFGSTQLFTSGALASNNIDWTLQAEIARNGATSQVTWVQFMRNGLSPIVDVSSTTVDLAANQAIKITGQGTATADIVVNYWKLILLT